MTVECGPAPARPGGHAMRHLARMLLAILSVLGAAGGVAAQTWPTKPVKFIVPSPAGTAPDIIARLISDRIAVPLRPRVVVDHPPGAGGLPRLSAFVRSPAHRTTFALRPP